MSYEHKWFDNLPPDDPSHQIGPGLVTFLALLLVIFMWWAL